MSLIVFDNVGVLEALKVAVVFMVLFTSSPDPQHSWAKQFSGLFWCVVFLWLTTE